jgi:glycerate 2-kinase
VRAQRLSDDAVTIWRAGLAAVDGRRLVSQAVTPVAHDRLQIGHRTYHLPPPGRLIVVGAGKAAAAMALGLSDALQPWPAFHHRLIGWINAPESQLTGGRIGQVELHAGRPPGINLPTPAALFGTEKILELVASAQPEDLVVCLLSGGASALLTAPLPDLQLEDKIEVAALLSRSGVSIEAMNTVRRCLSRVKAGGLARRCRARQMVCLVISDVPGDDLATIGSGPTCLSAPPDPVEAWKILHTAAETIGEPIPPRVIACLQRQQAALQPAALQAPREQSVAPPGCEVEHLMLGNNAVAVDAAGQTAVQLGYRYWMESSRKPEGLVEPLAVQLTARWLRMRQPSALHDCLISGGEPTVQLPPADRRGRGGRNQQLALACLIACQRSADPHVQRLTGMALVSAGTDGEDGPTDAAGAVIDAAVMARCQQLGLDPQAFLDRCDAYRFFEATGGLLRTGPTFTNVCDLRVALVQPEPTI